MHQITKQSANRKNVDKYPDLVQKQFVKEDARDIGIIFDGKLIDYIPHIGIIPIGIATPQDKKPRLYRHGTLQLTEQSKPINTLVDRQRTEPEIRYQYKHRNAK